ncbi:MAG: acyl-CoA thioesterase-2 [Candidatus Azotimanducaceae bacterium]|jgi:acyl-CoA thioesterase-2
MNQIEPALIDLPQLMHVTASPSEQSRYECFIGQPESYGAIGIYGGHFVGQALAACFETVDEGKLAQSLHAYFLSPGDPLVAISYSVERLREGRGSDTRSVTASQNGRSVFHMIANFKIPEAGDEHQKTMPEIVDPEVLQVQQAKQESKFSPPMLVGGRVSMMMVGDGFFPQPFVEGRKPQLQTWMKSNHNQKISDSMSQCVLAFLSDGTLMFNSVLPYGVPFQSHRLTSLDHSVWFHRMCDVQDWMFFDQRSTAAADGRGMNEGEVFDKQGCLIFTTSQESMLRRIPK